MIEDDKIYEWAKREKQMMLRYLEEDWAIDCDIDCDNEEVYKQHMEQMHKIYKETEIIISWLSGEISYYEREVADAIANKDCFY